MHAPRLVVYTAIFGDYEGLIEQPARDGVDYVCFTDTPRRSRRWQVRRIDPPCADPTRAARSIKILAHEYLPEYTTSVWLDANFLVVGDLGALVNQVLSRHPMAVFDHNQARQDARNCAYREFASMCAWGERTGVYKDDPAIMAAQIERYRHEGYPENNGLISSGALLRHHHDPGVVTAMRCWWEEIAKGSRRDQLSFNYAAWKCSLDYYIVPGDLRRNAWVYMLGIHRKNYWAKMLRYRLKRLCGILRHA